MRRYRNPLLAGVAALALMAGTGLASAQAPSGGGMQGSQDHGSRSGGAGTGLHAQGQGQTNRGALNANSGAQRNGTEAGSQAQVQGKVGSTGQTGNHGTAQNGNRGLQGNAQGNGQAGTAAQNGMERNNRQAQGNNHGERNNRGLARNQGRTGHGQQSTVQRERTLHGLQGNASGQMPGQVQGQVPGQGTSRRGPQTGQANGTTNGTTGRQAHTGRASGTNVQLSSQQRTQIRQTVIEARNAPRVGHVDFDVSVGTVVPRGRIHVVPVPETLVRIEPSWRGYLYFVYSDEVVIVNPRDMRIIAVLPA